MHPQLTHLMAEQRIADMRHEADRRRLARNVASERQPVRRHSGIAQLFAWLTFARASKRSGKGRTTAVSKRLTHGAPGGSDVAVARGDSAT